MLVRSCALAVLLFLLLLAAFSAHAQTAVSFQEKVTVSTTKITLGDIANISPAGPQAEALAALPVTTAPPPGKSKQLYVVPVITSLRHRKEAADVDWQGSETITVERLGQKVDPKKLQQIIAQYLAQHRDKLPQAEIRFTSFRAPETILLPPGKLSWKVTPSRPQLIGSNSFSIFFLVDGKPAQNCIVKGKLEAMAQVATTAVTLPKGHIITEKDITFSAQDINKLHQPYTDSQQLIGMQVSQTVPTGTALEQKYIVIPPVIKKGDLVKITLTRGMLTLSAKGEARKDGRPGETIQIKNISSNRIIHCRVDGPGMVSVEF